MVLLTLMLLGGCQEEEEVPPAPIERGDAAACIGNNLGIQFEFVEVNYQVSGVIEEVGGGIQYNLVPCDISTTQTIQFRSEDGVVWALGWRIRDRSGLDVAPGMPLLPGTEIDVVFRGAIDGKAHNGFIVRDEYGIVAAVNMSDQYKALYDADMAPLSVNYGEWVTGADMECGAANGYAIDFQGDDTLTLSPFDRGSFMLEGREMNALAISALEYETETSCAATGNELGWAVFRMETLEPSVETPTETGTATGTGTGTATGTGTGTGSTDTGDTGT